MIGTKHRVTRDEGIVLKEQTQAPNSRSQWARGMTSTADEKDAIRELMARYCHALDACKFSEVASLFAEDGEWTTTYGKARGRTQIETLLASVVPKDRKSTRLNSSHLGISYA